MCINGYFCGLFYSRIEARHNNDFAAYEASIEEKILVAKLKGMELCAIKVPIVETAQQKAERIRAVYLARWISLVACVAIGVIVSSGWFAEFSLLPLPVVTCMNLILFWLPPVIMIFVGVVANRSFKRTCRDLFQNGISGNKWIPVSSLDTRVMGWFERACWQNISSLVIQVGLIFACLYFKNVLHMYYMRYVAQYIVTRIVFYNDKLLPQGIYYIAWQKWKKNHR